ncbi:MAG: methionine--tRNA ligase [Ruminococcaceae bacterium]|nr:methionine--tRNA ligase [Oscillospiraceae bacterium]
MKEKFYITTPIYYPSADLHIGHCYTTVAADIIARFKRMQGFDVMFLTGTDEHGQKIEDAAKSAGVSPKEYVDKIVAGIFNLWETMNIDYDRFIRTTDDYHIKSVQRIFRKLYEKGDIYKGFYSGLYCKPCESFWTDSQTKDNLCPDCGRELTETSEEAYFFRMSTYAEKLLDYYEEHPDFLLPVSRKNEMISFINQGLEDLCVSRTSLKWGVPVDFDPGHVVYVWVDALSNYITALGYENNNYSDMDNYWPADLQLMAKEIVRFHSIIWPSLLMALELPLPKKVFGHGWLLFGGGKMSKSVGNVIDPLTLCERYGVDSLRYYLIRDIQFGSDGNFTNEGLISRINSDLANDLGNLLSRTVSMITKYFDGTLPSVRETDSIDDELIELSTGLFEKVKSCVDSLQLPQALIEIFKVVSRANKYIDETKPWILAKEDEKAPRLASVLYNLSETLRIIAVMLTPFMPNTAPKILKAIGASEGMTSFDSLSDFGLLSQNTTVSPTKVLFPRIDVEEELKALEEILTGEPEKCVSERLPEIDYDQFMGIELRAVKVVECKKVKNADKLLEFRVFDGERERTIVSGIAEWYSPDELVGKKIAAVLNLRPTKIRGIVSEGMLLSSDDNEKAVLLFLDDKVSEGSRIR